MPAELDRCVQQVKGQKGVESAFAICRASLGTDEDIKRRRKKKKSSHGSHMTAVEALLGVKPQANSVLMGG